MFGLWRPMGQRCMVMLLAQRWAQLTADAHDEEEPQADQCHGPTGREIEDVGAEQSYKDGCDGKDHRKQRDRREAPSKLQCRRRWHDHVRSSR